MNRLFLAVPALVLAGTAAAQGDGRADARDPGAKVAPVEHRSAFEGYRRFAEQELVNWRRANEAVRDAGGHASHQAPKPQPGQPETSGRDHGGHK